MAGLSQYQWLHLLFRLYNKRRSWQTEAIGYCNANGSTGYRGSWLTRLTWRITGLFAVMPAMYYWLLGSKPGWLAKCLILGQPVARRRRLAAAGYSVQLYCIIWRRISFCVNENVMWRNVYSIVFYTCLYHSNEMRNDYSIQPILQSQ